jgi:hypothetical protein
MDPTPLPTKWLTLTEAADATGRSAPILKRLAQDGAIPGRMFMTRYGAEWRVLLHKDILLPPEETSIETRGVQIPRTTVDTMDQDAERDVAGFLLFVIGALCGAGIAACLMWSL